MGVEKWDAIGKLGRITDNAGINNALGVPEGPLQPSGSNNPSIGPRQWAGDPSHWVQRQATLKLRAPLDGRGCTGLGGASEGAGDDKMTIAKFLCPSYGKGYILVPKLPGFFLGGGVKKCHETQQIDQRNVLMNMYVVESQNSILF